MPSAGAVSSTHARRHARRRIAPPLKLLPKHPAEIVDAAQTPLPLLNLLTVVEDAGTHAVMRLNRACAALDEAATQAYSRMPSDRWYGLLNQLDTYVRNSNAREAENPGNSERVAGRILVLASAFLVNEAIALSGVEHLPRGRASRGVAVEAQRDAVALAHGVADALLSGVGRGRWRWIASLHSADGIAAMLLAAPRPEPIDGDDASDELVETAPAPASTAQADSAIAAPVFDSTAAVTDPAGLESLLRDAVDAEPWARERLFAEVHPLVLRYCRARLGRQETVMGSADDVAQEVCLAVVNSMPGYTARGLSFRAFVYGIAAHKVTDAFRAIGRNRAEPVADIPDTPLVHDGPEHHLLQVELTERLGALLHLLTPRQREVLVLRIAVGLSAEETAQAVGSTPGAVRITQHRALNRLRRKVDPAGTHAEDELDNVDDDV